ncbi:unnamed protein product [Somion occarium]|uniref:RRM domain-containing protein n=1 Tax=Somion occarium TaxID=3059160 RepID=A0ABP1DBU0_9APHY
MDATALAKSLSRSAYRSRPPPYSRHIKLYNLPRTAIPADLRRLCAKNNLSNTEKFNLLYERFKPTGKGFVSFTSPEFTPNAVKTLQHAMVGGSRVEVELVSPNGMNQPGRTRGARGKAQAVERGLFLGDGPDAGLTRAGTNVLLTGLPGKSTADIIKQYVRTFKLAGYEDKGDVIKVDLPVSRMAVTASFVVRLASMSEAHRLVRRLHMTFYRSDLFFEKYPLKAHVIY